MKKLILTFISVIMIIQFSPLFADTYQEGLELYKQKKFQEAIEKFEESLKDGSADKEDIHVYLGIAYYAVNQDDKAFRELNIAKNSKNKVNREAAYSNFAMFAFSEGNLGRAEENCLNAIKESPENPMHTLMMGKIYAEMEENTKAKEYFNKTIKISADNCMAYYELGNIYLKEKDYVKAYEQYKKSIDIRNDFMPSYEFIIEYIPEEIIPKEEYKEILTKYLELNPNDSKAKQKLDNLTIPEKKKKNSF